MSDLISRSDAIDALKGLPTWWADGGGYHGGAQPPMVALLDPEDAVSAIENLPSAQPELTDDRAIEHLQSTGWMQNHDKEMYEMGLRERLADDSDSYDSLIPSGDTILRQAAIDAFEKECTQDESYGYIDIKSAVDVLNDLPSVKLATDLQFLQPESEYVFYDSDHGFCINTQDVLDYLRKELRNG